MNRMLIGWSILLVLLTALMPLSLLFGAVHIDPAAAWREWQAGLSIREAPMLNILLYQRLPRTLAALIAGAGLAVVGASFQAILRNPLAEPYTLGVASASALGAWLALLLSDAGLLPAKLLWIPILQPLAFLFGMTNVLLVYLLATRRVRPSPAVMLLAGVTLGVIANAGIMFTRYLARPDRLVVMDRFLMGGVDVLGYWPVFTLAIGVIPAAIALVLQAGRLDQFGFSEELAASRGIRIDRLQLMIFLLGSFVTAMIVSEAGPIGFVGLIIPHIVRTFTGSRHRILLPASILAGAIFLCGCDLGARTLLPGETPIGIVTTLIGGPVFLYLLLRRRFIDWA